MSTIPDIPLECFQIIASYMDPNPAVYTRLALVSRSFYRFFMCDSQWRLLNPYDALIGTENAIASKYIEDSKRNKYLGALWNLLDCDLWSRVMSAENDPQRAAISELSDFFAKFRIQHSSSRYANMASVLCNFGIPVYGNGRDVARLWEMYSESTVKMALTYLAKVILSYKWLPSTDCFSRTYSYGLLACCVQSLDKEGLLRLLRSYGILYKYFPGSKRLDHEVIFAAMTGVPPADYWHAHFVLKNVPTAYFTDREFMLKAASLINTLKFFSQSKVDCPIDWTTDREFVLAAVKYNGWQVVYAANEFFQDPEIVLIAIRQSRDVMVNVYPDEVLNDRRVLLEYMREYPYLLSNWDPLYLRDREVVMTAAKNCAQHPFPAFKDVAPELRADRDLVMLVAGSPQANKFVLPYMDKRFFKDRDIMMEMFRGSLDDLSIGSESFCDDKEMVLAAVSRSCLALKYASQRLKKDPEIVIAALKCKTESPPKVEALKFASSSLLEDRDFMTKAIALNPHSYYYASSNLQEDYDMRFKAVEAAKPSAWRQYQGSGEGSGYTVFVARLARIGRVSEETPLYLRDNAIVMIKAVRFEPFTLELASDELKRDRTLVMEAVKVDGKALALASKQIKRDEKIILEAFKTYPEACGNATPSNEFAIRRFKIYIREHTCFSSKSRLFEHLTREKFIFFSTDP